MVRTIERLENLIFFFLGIFLFYSFSNNWILFFILFLIPDISILAYNFDKKAGPRIYNLIHNYILALILLVVGTFLNLNFLMIAGSILICHTGLDRALGFGLKYDKNFKETHIQKL